MNEEDFFEDFDARKRILTKVRAQFLNKRADNNNPLSNNNPFKKPPPDAIHAVNPSVGLVESNGKVFVDAQYFNLYYSMSTSIIEDHNRSNAVTVHLYRKEEKIQVGLEAVAKRLESYGDLELATWAHRVRKYQANYPKVMEEYFNLIYSENHDVFLTMKKKKNAAILACKEIESKYPYCKVLHFFGKESNQIMSCTYSEWFLKEMGHSVESFIDWSKKNGLLHFIDSNCKLYVDFARQLLDGFSITAGPVYEGLDYDTWLYDKDGNQKKGVVNSTTILEPTTEGYFLYEYFILKEKETNMEVINVGTSHKCVKKGFDGLI